MFQFLEEMIYNINFFVNDNSSSNIDAVQQQSSRFQLVSTMEHVACGLKLPFVGDKIISGCVSFPVPDPSESNKNNLYYIMAGLPVG